MYMCDLSLIWNTNYSDCCYSVNIGVTVWLENIGDPFSFEQINFSRKNGVPMLSWKHMYLTIFLCYLIANCSNQTVRLSIT
jgi:hypothetical protein